MNVTEIWNTEDAVFLKDLRSIYDQEVMFYDLAIVVVDQDDIDRIWMMNVPPYTVPLLPHGCNQGLFVFYHGGDLDISNIEIKDGIVVSLGIKRIFPTEKDTMRARLYVPGIVDVSGQAYHPHNP